MIIASSLGTSVQILGTVAITKDSDAELRGGKAR